MRIRTIKPEFWSSEKVASLSVPARMLFIGLWGFADDFGRGRSNPKLLKASIFPLDDDVSSSDVTDFFKEIAHTDMVHEYEANGKDYYHIVDWVNNQDPRYCRSKLPVHPDPTCTEDDPRCAELAQFGPEGSKGDVGTGNRDKGTGNRESEKNPDEADI